MNRCNNKSHNHNKNNTDDDDQSSKMSTQDDSVSENSNQYGYNIDGGVDIEQQQAQAIFRRSKNNNNNNNNDDLDADELAAVAAAAATVPPTLNRIPSDRQLSHFSKQFDFDGDGVLNKDEQSVRDIFAKGSTNGNGPDKRDVFRLAREQSFAKREARTFKKMTVIFVAISVFLLLATFGLTFVAVQITKESKVDGQGHLVATGNNKQQISTLGAGTVAPVNVGDDMAGVTVSIGDFEETYVATIPREHVEEIFEERLKGIPVITTNVHYEGTSDETHNWQVTGDIDRYFNLDGKYTVYTNLETNYFPGWTFTVICPNDSSICGITQRFYSDETSEQVQNNRQRQRRRYLAEPINKDSNIPVSKEEMTGGRQTNFRRLAISPDVWNDLSMDCWLAEYELELYFADHFFLIATPVDKDNSANCPSLSIDADYLEDPEGNPIKKLTYIDGVDLSQIETYAFTQKTVPLVQFSKAVDQARVHNYRATVNEDGVDQEERAYHMFFNNCGTFILDVLEQVDVQMDNDAVTYVVDGLMSSEPFQQRLAKEAQNESIFQTATRKLLGDRALVRMVVTDYLYAHSKGDL